MSSLKPTAVALVLGLSMACAQQGSTPPNPIAPTGSLSSQGGGPSPLSATVQFGLPNVGSPFPPPSGHDQSSHAKDNLVPRTVVVASGGTVTFNLPAGSVHQVAIYDDGTKPQDIDTSILTGGGAGCPPVPLIDDSSNRLAVLGAQPCAGGPTSPSYTFADPGRYLVICTFVVHFVEFQMYGWVVVN